MIIIKKSLFQSIKKYEKNNKINICIKFALKYLAIC